MRPNLFLVRPWVALSASILAFAGCSSFSNQAVSQRRELRLENTWARSTLKRDFYGFRRMNRMSPIIVDTMLVEANAIDGVLAYDRHTGQELWRHDISNGVEGGIQAAEGKLYFGASDGQFYALDAHTGKEIWTFPVRAETLAAPTYEAGIVYFESGSDMVYALDAATGKQLWTYNRQVAGALSIRATTRPVVAGEALIVGFSDGYVVSLKKRDGTLQWERKLGKAPRFKDVDATPVLDGKNMYVASFDAALYSLEIDTGSINWEVEEGGYLPVTLGQGALSDRLYYATATGKILVAEKATGKVIHSIAVNNGIATQPILHHGLLIYGESNGNLVVASAETGAELKHFEPGTGIVSAPTVVEQTGEAYFISNAATLYALKFEYIRPSQLLPWQVAL